MVSPYIGAPTCLRLLWLDGTREIAVKSRHLPRPKDGPRGSTKPCAAQRRQGRQKWSIQTEGAAGSRPRAGPLSRTGLAGTGISRAANNEQLRAEARDAEVAPEGSQTTAGTDPPASAMAIARDSFRQAVHALP